MTILKLADLSNMDNDMVSEFVAVTGATEETAAFYMQAHAGDLTAAVNAFFGEAHILST